MIGVMKIKSDRNTPAFQNPRPSGSWLRLGWPGLGWGLYSKYLTWCAHYCYLARAAHTSIDVGMHAHEVTSGVGWHFSSLSWGAASCRPLRIVFVCKGRGRVVLGRILLVAAVVNEMEW